LVRKTFNPPRSAVPRQFAVNVPRGIVFRTVLSWIDRRYLVKAPGNANNRAAVAWWRKSAFIRKYVGNTAP